MRRGKGCERKKKKKKEDVGKKWRLFIAFWGWKPAGLISKVPKRKDCPDF